ncbi:MAG: hypothetical protein C4518_07105 [Desulfobacteraceae bacterium]|nr:MAG: hypothetical protein C4518_07105 [Desulfobacteraceae bacterium]
MKKTCNINPKMNQLLSAFADGHLSEKDRSLVVRHLEACDLCRDEYAAIQSIDRLLRKSEELEPSANFADSFWRKVDAMEAAKERKAWFNWRDWGFRPVWAAAAATLVIASGVFLYHRTPFRALDDAGDSTGLLIAEDIDLYDDFEVVQHLELLEQWETISSMEEI